MLKHVSYITPQAQAVTTFYGLLGATTEKDVTAADGLRRLVLRFEGGGRLQFFVTAHPGPTVGAEWLEHIALELPDFEGALSALMAQGAPVVREPQRLANGRRVAFVLDPDGRHVELLERLG